MIDFNLAHEVISDFSQIYTFTRATKSINNLGRQVDGTTTTKDIFCYIHPAIDKDTVNVAQEGYHPEQIVKIFAPLSVDISIDDIVSYSGSNWRVFKENIKLVGDYKKYYAGLLDD